MRSGRLATLTALTFVAGTVMVSAPARSAAAHAAGDPVLLGDLNTVGAGMNIGEIEAVGDDVYFTAETPARGVELWFHDASANTTKIVKDIYPGTGSSFPSGLTEVGTGLFFAATDPATGTELWRTDGTLAGTTLVKDVNPGPAGSSPKALTAFGTPGPSLSVFFAADDGVTHAATDAGDDELWAWNAGSAATTLREPDVTGVTNVAVVGTQVYFNGRGFGGDAKGEELWHYDGADSTQRDLYLGSNHGSPRSFTVAGTTLYFSADVDAGPRRIHRMIDADQAVPPAPVNFTEGYDPGWLVTSLSKLWFAGSPTAGAAPVLYSLTSAGSPVADSSVADPTHLAGQAIGLNPGVWFAEHGADGTELGLRRPPGANFHKDIVAGALSSSPMNPMPVTGGVIVYRALNGMWAPVRVNLSNGSVTEFPPFAPMFVERDLASPSRDGNGGWYFEASSVADGGGLWHFSNDGTVLTKITGNVDETAGSGGAGFTAFGDRVAFSATDGVSQPQPWAYDPATGTATQLTGPTPALSSADPAGFAVAGATLFASAELAAIGGTRMLWASDGTAGGTRPVSGASTEPSHLTAFANGVLYQAISPAAGAEPWFSDGTSGGTVQLGDLVSGPTESDPASFVSLGNVAVFQAEGGGGAGHDLWVTDGTPGGTALLAATDAGFTSGVAAGGRAFYGANAAGVGVWASDGTVDGTTRVTLHGNPTLDPSGLTVRTDGSRVFAAGGGELWVIDAATGDASQVALPAGATPDLRRSAMAGTRFVFSATTPAGGRLFALDGLTAIELDPAGWGAGWALGGGLPFVPFAAHHEFAYFVARNDALGLEIWQTDGTTAGTVAITDLNPGPANSSPTSVTVIGERLYFSAVHPDTGREPYFLEFQPHPPEPPGATAPISPIEPARYWDTRPGEPTFDHLFEGTGLLGGGQRFEVTIAGRGSVPSDAAGVAANLTVIGPDGPGFATLFPCTPDVPKASHVNYLPGDILANNVVDRSRAARCACSPRPVPTSRSTSTATCPPARRSWGSVRRASSTPAPTDRP